MSQPRRPRSKKEVSAAVLPASTGRLARPRITRAVALVVGFLVLSALAFWSRTQSVLRRAPGSSVLLITVDTLRADALGAYGNPRVQTPWMDRLGAEGTRFAFAHAHNVLTLPSHANILTGRHPFEHGVRDNQGFRLPPTLDTLATLLQKHGYATGAFVSAFPLDSRFGLQRGFDVYDDHFADAQGRPAFLEQERTGTETVALAREWIARRKDGPYFAWVHLYEPHYPYAPKGPLAERFREDPYLGEVAAADAALGPLLEDVHQGTGRGRTLVVLTADHGESLGEHGEATHGIFAYEATLRVPLILHAPRILAPRVVAAPARHVDILPTVLDALALPTPEGLPGRSLLPLAAGENAAAVTTYFEALSGPLNRGWAPLHGVIRDRLKHIDLPRPELYDLPTDPNEMRNLAGLQPQDLDGMRTLLASFRSSDPGVGRRTEEADVRARMRSLGYLGAPSVPRRDGHTEEDDPKRLIGLDAMLQEVTAIFLQGDLDRALARARELVRLRPGMAVSLLTLAQVEREKGDLTAAVATLEKALVANPADTVTLALLGSSLTQAGREKQAVALLEPEALGASPDPDVVVAYSVALARAGRTGDALAALAAAERGDPSNARLLVAQGTLHVAARDEARAREAFAEALRRNPAQARAHSSLAFLDAEAGHLPEALEHWRKALALDPREAETLLALASVLRGRGGPAPARPYLELFVATADDRRYAREIERARSLLATAPTAAPQSR